MRFLIDTEQQTIELLNEIEESQKEQYYWDLHYFFSKKQYDGFKAKYNFKKVVGGCLDEAGTQ